MEAFTALLTDGVLRSRFAADRKGTASLLCKDAAAIASVAALDVEELNYQARVLLRKRFERVLRYLPKTVNDLTCGSWETFCRYVHETDSGRNRDCPWTDAYAFLKYVSAPEKLNYERELNRLRFMAEKRTFRCRVLGHRCLKNLTSLKLQVLMTHRNGCREILFSLG